MAIRLHRVYNYKAIRLYGHYMAIELYGYMDIWLQAGYMAIRLYGLDSYKAAQLYGFMAVWHHSLRPYSLIATWPYSHIAI